MKLKKRGRNVNAQVWWTSPKYLMREETELPDPLQFPTGEGSFALAAERCARRTPRPSSKSSMQARVQV